MQFTFTLYYLTTSALKRLHRLVVRMLLRWVSLHPFPVYPAHNSVRCASLYGSCRRNSAQPEARSDICVEVFTGEQATQPRTEEQKEERGNDGPLSLNLQLGFFSERGGATCSGVWCDLLTPPSLWTSSRDESKVLFGVDRPKWQLTHGRVTIAFGENPFLYLIPGSCACVCVKSYVGTAAEPLQEALLMQKWGEDFVVVFLPHRFN